MKKIIYTPGLILAGALLLFSSCNKKESEPVLNEEIKQFNEDAGTYKAELDQADGDINNIFSNTSLGKKGGGWQGNPLCGATIDTSLINGKIITINFDGVTPCFSPSRTRSGKIILELIKGNRWGDAGSVIEENFVDFKVTRMSDNKSIRLNGKKTYTNVNGNDWAGFLMGTKNLHFKERVNFMIITYNTGQTAQWNSARDIEWKFVNKTVNTNIPYDHIKIYAKADSTLESWGYNRLGKYFETKYNSTIEGNTYCGIPRFTAGELVHTIDNKKYTFTFGLDKDGNPTPYACAYGFKVAWDLDGKIGSKILSY